MALAKLRLSIFGLIAVAVGQLSISSCAPDSEGFYFGALGLNEGRILIVNSQTNPAQHTVTMYDLSGNFLGVVVDTSKDNSILRGVAFYDGLNVVVSQDSPDQLSFLNLFSGQMSAFAVNSLLAGNIYDVVTDRANNFYVVESNTVEKFNGSQRLPATGNNPYIPTTVGPCVQSAGRGISITAAGRLVLASFNNDDILVYDVSGLSSATCFTAYTGFANSVNPIDVRGHSNGNIYITGNGSDAIYETPDANPLVPVVIFNDVGIIDNPTAIAELPNGNLIVASDATDAIIEITTTGEVVNAPLIKNAFTSTVLDLLVIPPQ